MITEFKKGDLIKTNSRGEHLSVLKHLRKHGMTIGGVAWEDRYTDYEDGYNRLFYNGNKWKSFDKEDLVLEKIKKKIKRKFKGKKVLSLRTSYETSVVKHHFF